MRLSLLLANKASVWASFSQPHSVGRRCPATCQSFRVR